ncbi:MAG: rhamnogalacturonan acetylesterase [Flavobacterium sp.]|nr:rhamnogalacturonan acetylesterase [Flavobacterium sp.]
MLQCFAFLVLLTVRSSIAEAQNFKFDFGNGKLAKGFTQVLSTDIYTTSKGFGFDFGSTVTSIETKSKDALNGDCITSQKPFYFSVNVPEGNYNVSITFGNLNVATATTVKAESRRLMLENILTKPGEFVTKTFTINRKDRQITASQKISLKERELTKLDWDDKLSFEFTNTKPAITAMEISKVTDAVTVYLAGNSTVVNQDDEPWAAWGQMIPNFFKAGVSIANHAESGLTLGSFLGSKRLEKVLSIIKPGDYLFIEFGHNDQKEKGSNDGAWKSYTERLKLFISEAKKKGAIPVVVTSTARRNFDSTGKNVNSLGDYPAAARKAAADEGVALIDLNAMSTALYEALGPNESKKAFVHYPANSYPGQDKPLADNTHFNPYGAYQLAKCIVEGIKQNRLGLANYLVDTITTFNPSKPDALATWHWYESPKSTVVKPSGN